MPYITEREKDDLLVNHDWPGTTGQLNFMITHVIAMYTQRNGLNYATINNVIGALENAKLEYYRRVAAPYEDEKIKENGDVY